jgi:uncharacterized protein involved in exopolysaccharide biosynthesis
MTQQPDASALAAEETGGLPWRDVVRSLVRHRKLVAALAVAGGLVMGVGKFLEPPVYEARAALTLVSNRADVKMSPSEAAAMQNERVDETLVNSEAAWLRNETTLREVLEPWRVKIEAGIAEHTPSAWDTIVGVVTFPFRLPGLAYRRLHGAPEPSWFDGWVGSVSARLEVSTARLSNVIDLGFTDGSPEFAANVLKALITYRMKRQAAFSQQDEAAKFYEEQSRLLAARVEEAERALQAFYQQEGIVGGTEERDAVRAQIADIRTQYASTQTELAEARSREAFLETAMRSLPKNVVTANPGSSMEGRVLELMLERSKLLSRYAPTSVKIVDLDQQIAEAKRLLREERQLINTASSGTNPTWAELEQELIETRAKIASLDARMTALHEQEQANLDRMRALVEGTSSLERLETDLERAKEAHRTYVGKQEAARLSSALDDSQILNITVSQPVRVPQTPKPARKGVYVLLGMLAGLVLGGVIAFVRDLIDPTVKSAEEVGRLTGMTIIGEVTS